MIIKALSIAGFDGSGGAGIQADLKTFSALGCYAMTVLTALPIQNTCGVSNCYSIPPEAIREQLASIFDDLAPDVIKIGMLFNQEIVNLVAEFLAIHAQHIPIVLDPVMIAKSGDRLLLPDAINALKLQLMPLVSIVTPNLDEAEALTGISIHDREDMLLAAGAIIDLGAKAVLIKGGHFDGVICADLLLTNDESHWFSAVRIDTINTHGTGCTLSAAIAAGLAHGLSVVQSCAQAKVYLSGAIESFKDEVIGVGNGPVNHFHKIWSKLD